MRMIRFLVISYVISLPIGLFAQQTTVPVASQSEKAAPSRPATVDQIRRMMDVTHATERIKEAMHAAILQQKKSMTFFPDAFRTDFEAEMAKVDWVAVSTPTYQKYLSQDDADKAIAFYSTDAGQRALDSSMAVSQEMSAKGFDIGKEIGTRLGQKYQKEIEEGMQKMQQEKSTTSPN